MFNGFEQILMIVIEHTSHAKDFGETNDLARKTDEQRFDDAMSAIFGDAYERRFKKTWDLTSEQLRAIKSFKDKGGSIANAVRKFAEFNSDEEFKQVCDRVRLHLSRNSELYENYHSVDGDEDITSSPYYNDDEQKELIKQRREIFQALKKAGWPI